MDSFKKIDDVLTMLFHLGYLGYNNDIHQVFFPNKELLNEFNYITSNDEWNSVAKKIIKSRQIIEATIKCNEKEVDELLEEYYNRTDNKTYNNENALEYSILFA